jgi:hypothetical protein
LIQSKRERESEICKPRGGRRVGLGRRRKRGKRGGSTSEKGEGEGERSWQ